ncbi:MAG: hypothetical protein E3J23_08460 [Candidatus Stahlbacteria bacterium]|nr:MAG: hypothetical protein E3J23_08460 [Candidatus Stahlbacteria bacterium]
MSEKEIEIEVINPEVKLKKASTDVSVMVKELSIKTEDDYSIAQVLGKAINEIIKDVKSHFSPIKQSTQKAHKDAVALEKTFLKGPTESKEKLKKLMISFEEEQEAIRLAKEEKIKTELQKNIDQGNEIANGIISALDPEANVAVADVHVQSTFKTAGSTTDNWKGEVIDFHKFLMAVVRLGYTEFLEVNQKALNDYAKSTEGKKLFDGVRFYNNKVKKF